MKTGIGTSLVITYIKSYYLLYLHFVYYINSRVNYLLLLFLTLIWVDYLHSAWFVDGSTSVLVSNAVKPGGCISWHLWPLGGFNRTV